MATESSTESNQIIISVTTEQPGFSVPNQHAKRKIKQHRAIQPISGRVDRASATETVDSGSIPGRVKPKTIQIGIHSFSA